VVSGQLSAFSDQLSASEAPPAKIETAYHRADAAIQKLVHPSVSWSIKLKADSSSETPCFFNSLQGVILGAFGATARGLCPVPSAFHAGPLLNADSLPARNQ